MRGDLISGIPPLDIEDVEYCSLETKSVLSCLCGFLPVRKVAFEGVNTGRRFIACMREVNFRVASIYLSLKNSSYSAN